MLCNEKNCSVEHFVNLLFYNWLRCSIPADSFFIFNTFDTFKNNIC